MAAVRGAHSCAPGSLIPGLPTCVQRHPSSGSDRCRLRQSRELHNDKNRPRTPRVNPRKPPTPPSAVATETTLPCFPSAKASNSKMRWSICRYRSNAPRRWRQAEVGQKQSFVSCHQQSVFRYAVGRDSLIGDNRQIKKECLCKGHSLLFTRNAKSLGFVQALWFTGANSAFTK